MSEFEPRRVAHFWMRVERTPTCWLWGGSKNADGYGWFHIENERISTHRFAYRVVHGEIPDGLQIDHLCRNRACVNPDHLEAVDSRTNTLRGTSPAARNAKKTHCKRGHRLTEENVYLYKGGRTCKMCRRFHIVKQREKHLFRIKERDRLRMRKIRAGIK